MGRLAWGFRLCHHLWSPNFRPLPSRDLRVHIPKVEKRNCIPATACWDVCPEDSLNLRSNFFQSNILSRTGAFPLVSKLFGITPAKWGFQGTRKVFCSGTKKQKMSLTKHGSRLIDSMPQPLDRKEMKVLVLGLCRTGTTSIREALAQLGLKAYGYKEGALDGHCRYWIEAIDAKFNGIGRPYGPVEFQKLLADYSAVTDIPAALFVDELIEAFPRAKVVVSNRELDTWMASMEKVTLHIMSWRSIWILAPFDHTALEAPFGASGSVRRS